jgi:small subunit ribosomal protein S3
MGQKVNPKGYRLGIIYTWNSKWFSNKRDYSARLKQDILIRKFLKDKLKESGIDSINTERSANSVTIIIKAAKPGIIIGRSGAGAEDLKKEIKRKFLDTKTNLNLNILEVERPGLSAAVVLQGMIEDIEKRIPFRRVLKSTIGRVERAGAKGVKVRVSGRLNGAEIARTEVLFSGKIPLHTLRADIDYTRGTAHTIYGAIGIKIWIYKGEVFKENQKSNTKV